MEKEIVAGNLGSIANYDVEFKGGKLIAKLDAEKAEYGIKAGVFFEAGAEAVIDAIARAIPGTIDDVLLGIVKTALLKV